MKPVDEGSLKLNLINKALTLCAVAAVPQDCESPLQSFQKVVQMIENE